MGAFSYPCMTFRYCAIDLDPMILIYEPYLDILKVYPHTISEFLGQGQLRARTSRHTERDRRNRGHYHGALAGDNKTQSHNICYITITLFYLYIYLFIYLL